MKRIAEGIYENGIIRLTSPSGLQDKALVKVVLLYSESEDETFPDAAIQVKVIQDLRESGLRLTAPLYVTVEPGENVVVSNADLDIFGYGETEDEALRDFCQCVSETYFELKEEQDSLGPHMERIWNYLSRAIIETG